MATFVQRTTAPDESNSFYYSDNPFYASGYGLPNCTCYAWGRFYEISNQRPSLSLGNAEDWWSYPDGYSRGQTPKLGAVICWRKGAAGDDSDGAGHVEVVEAINEDGTIITTGSAYNGFLFRTKTRSDDGNWGGGDYTFQGFIYNPVEFSGSGTGGFVVPEPIKANRYLTSAEMHTNATYIWWFLSQRGWTINAVAGMLGNMEVESSINPGIWQNLTEGNTEGGFGLTQWTPATKLINWAESNGYDYTEMDTQLLRICWEQETENGQFSDVGTEYDITFTEFKESTLPPNELGMIFLLCYERPEDQNQPGRGENAEYWYTYLSGIDITPGRAKRKRRTGYKFVLFCNKNWRNPT